MQKPALHDRRHILKQIGTATTILGLPVIAAACGEQNAAANAKRFDGPLLSSSGGTGNESRLPPGQQLGTIQPQDKSPQQAEATIEKHDARQSEGMRLPKGQETISHMRDMGGQQPFDTGRKAFSLKVHGLVENPLDLSFLDLIELPTVELTCDVHCVTRWSLFDTVWTGVRVSELAERAKVSKKARYLIFECAWGYTANIDLEEAMKDNVLVTWKVNGSALAPAHGAPVRSLVPDRYFWKSGKWLTGLRFQEFDQPGYWEVRGYHNHADPWREERFS